MPADGTDRRQRGHLSFSGFLVPAALIVVAGLSLGSVWTGMRYVTVSQPSESSKRRNNDAMILPVNSPTDNGDIGDGLIDDTGDDVLPLQNGNAYEYDSNDNQAIDDIDEEGVIPPPPSDDKGESEEMIDEANVSNVQSTDGQINEAEANDSPIDSETAERQSSDDISISGASNDTNLTPSRIYPRVTSLEGASEAVFSQYLRGNSNDDEKKRTIKLTKKDLNQQKRLKNSKDFSFRDPLHEGDCEPMQPWQETSFPICNMMHELDFYGKTRSREFQYLTKGGYNQIFALKQRDIPEDPKLVMKILKWGTDYSDRNFDRVRRDGLILERLTKSPYVLDTYGFCGFDVLAPYAGGGTLSDKLYNLRRGKIELSPKSRLELATQAALGLADVHDIDGEGLSSVSHGDLKGSQYIFLGGKMLLGDFNRGRFLRRNSTAPETACTYTIGKNDAAFRSPEEYEYLPQTSAIDVYALGSILYEILTGNDVWHDTDTDDAQKYIRKGKRPKIDEELMKSDDPVDVALREAIDMCYVFDPQKRAKAGAVAEFLQKRLSELKE